MNWRCILICLLVPAVLLVCSFGCAKKEDAPPAQKPAPAPAKAPAKPAPSTAPAPKPAVQHPIATVQKPLAPVASTAPASSKVMKPFLDQKVRRESVKAGESIQKYFSTWEDTLLHHSRRPMEIHFQVDADQPFRENHTWSNTSNRAILDNLCDAYGLTWTIANDNTIRIIKKTP